MAGSQGAETVAGSTLNAASQDHIVEVQGIQKIYPGGVMALESIDLGSRKAR